MIFNFTLWSTKGKIKMEKIKDMQIMGRNEEITGRNRVEDGKNLFSGKDR